MPAIAAVFGCSEARVRRWIRRFDAEGPAGLYDRPRGGRPRKATGAVAERAIALLKNDPAQAGYLATFWTVAMLAAALIDQLDVVLSLGTVRRMLHHLGLRWGRPRLTMPDKVDPEKAAKQWAIVRAVVEAGPEATVLYADESRIQLLPLLRGMWHWVGEQVRIPTPGSNASRAIFGALNIRTGQWDHLIRRRMRAEDFMAFLTHLLEVYPLGTLILIVDNYSSHTAHAVADWLAVHPRLQLHYLPTYCSHLNPVEPIWLRLKHDLAANRLHASIEALADTVTAFFDQMSPAQALVWAAA